MGKVTYIALASILAVAGVMAYAGVAWLKVFTAMAILGFALLTIKWILIYADKHPQSATMEGSEIIAWQQHVTEAAAKTIQQPPKNSPIIPNPKSPPPQLDPPEEVEQ